MPPVDPIMAPLLSKLSTLIDTMTAQGSIIDHFERSAEDAGPVAQADPSNLAVIGGGFSELRAALPTADLIPPPRSYMEATLTGADMEEKQRENSRYLMLENSAIMSCYDFSNKRSQRLLTEHVARLRSRQESLVAELNEEMEKAWGTSKQEHAAAKEKATSTILASLHNVPYPLASNVDSLASLLPNFTIPTGLAEALMGPGAQQVGNGPRVGNDSVMGAGTQTPASLGVIPAPTTATFVLPGVTTEKRPETALSTNHLAVHNVLSSLGVEPATLKFVLDSLTSLKPNCSRSVGEHNVQCLPAAPCVPLAALAREKPEAVINLAGPDIACALIKHNVFNCIEVPNSQSTNKSLSSLPKPAVWDPNNVKQLPDAKQWIKTLIDYCNLLNWPLPAIMAHFLAGSAAVWWTQLVKQHDKDQITITVHDV